MNDDKTSKTSKVLGHMFINLVKISPDESTLARASAVIDGVIERLSKETQSVSANDWKKIRAAFCGMLAHGWAMGMNPYNNPKNTIDGAPLEVRVSKDILVSMEALKALRYVKKDELGRIEKAFFEPSAEAKVKEQIDRILGEIARKHWSK